MFFQKNTFPIGLKKCYRYEETLQLAEYKEHTKVDIDSIHSKLKTSFQANKTKPLEWRVQQLKQLQKGILELDDHLVTSCNKDFKSINDIVLELAVILSEISLGLEHLQKWSKREYVEKDLTYGTDELYIERCPFGLVLIFSPWNFPLRLTFIPLISAILAGNCCVLKPSELSPNTSATITNLVIDYLDTSCIEVINGGPEIAKNILELKWNFICYTGSTQIGKIVQEAGSKFLTPMLLELGGKCPAIVDDGVDLKVMARRIAWGKFMNAGQICLAPDYVVCSPKIKKDLIKYLISAIKSFYSVDPKNYPNYTKIVNKRHTQRIVDLLPSNNDPDAVIEYGGTFDVENRFVAPTILSVINKDHAKCMQEEIFGPILLIITMEKEEIIDYIKAKESPLSLYIFSSSQSFIDDCIMNIPSGGVTVNDVLMHAQPISLPFGGIGDSGMGNYNGKYGFETFSHKKSVLKRGKLEFINAIRYEPVDMELAVPIFFPRILYPLTPSPSRLKSWFNRFVSTWRFLKASNALFFNYLIGRYNKKLQ